MSLWTCLNNSIVYSPDKLVVIAEMVVVAERCEGKVVYVDEIEAEQSLEKSPWTKLILV